jgi:hypothetical protein
MVDEGKCLTCLTRYGEFSGMLLEPYWLRLVTMVVFDFGKVMFHLKQPMRFFLLDLLMPKLFKFHFTEQD